MAKKVVKKASALTTSSVDRLIASNIELQHKMADVLLGVKELNENVSNLVHIFKSAGEHIKADKYEDPMINRLNELLEQNKNLAKALMLLEKFVKEKQNTPASLSTNPY
ncbi:MAG TPA: hypothetical protein HA360_00840 [Nanoarchaeota archaeon]|nr:hypothetical protein [Candidatus Woesearchaeota archaeon]HIH15669.1 hypothetical protein [Nanoarchaeota archaeon]HIH59323.1 hypothetical protein [Nanoarchaeota archaeon]HII13598.1 hypothetical protein [Nanoarchaeota archaeon]HIJ04827.1 hypothetical protein [Nanoarchaeota archaeon]